VGLDVGGGVTLGSSAATWTRSSPSTWRSPRR